MARSQSSLTVICSKARSDSSATSASHSSLRVRRTRKSSWIVDIFLDTLLSSVGYPTQGPLLLLDPCYSLYYTRKSERRKDTRHRVEKRAKGATGCVEFERPELTFVMQV